MHLSLIVPRKKCIRCFQPSSVTTRFFATSPRFAAIRQASLIALEVEFEGLWFRVWGKDVPPDEHLLIEVA